MRASNLGEALKQAGFDPLKHRVKLAASEFVSAGGSREEWLAVYDAVTGMSGCGRENTASDGHPIGAAPRQQVEGGDAKIIIPSGHHGFASSPSSGRDREDLASSAQAGHLPGVLPVREPTESQRSASLIAAKAVSVTIMDTFKIDGVAIGSWSVALARVEARRKTRDGYILRMAVKAAGDAPDKALLRNVVKLEQMQRIRQASEEFADAS